LGKIAFTNFQKPLNSECHGLHPWIFKEAKDILIDVFCKIAAIFLMNFDSRNFETFD